MFSFCLKIRILGWNGKAQFLRCHLVYCMIHLIQMENYSVAWKVTLHMPKHYVIINEHLQMMLNNSHYCMIPIVWDILLWANSLADGYSSTPSWCLRNSKFILQKLSSIIFVKEWKSESRVICSLHFLFACNVFSCFIFQMWVIVSFENLKRELRFPAQN